jgi:hypothetical protein
MKILSIKQTCFFMPCQWDIIIKTKDNQEISLHAHSRHGEIRIDNNLTGETLFCEEIDILPNGHDTEMDMDIEDIIPFIKRIN